MVGDWRDYVAGSGGTNAEDALVGSTRVCQEYAVGSSEGPYYHVALLRYHVAFYLPKASGDMEVAEALDFPGAGTQGFDLPDARLMISSALGDLAQALLEEGKPLPVPSEEAHGLDADLIELVPLSVHAGITPK